MMKFYATGFPDSINMQGFMRETEAAAIAGAKQQMVDNPALERRYIVKVIAVVERSLPPLRVRRVR